jgi:hypothetical protein
MKKLLIIFLLISSPLFSQGPWGPGGNPGGGGGQPPCFPPPCVPINQGISLLLIAGLLLVINQIKKLNQ